MKSSGNFFSPKGEPNKVSFSSLGKEKESVRKNILYIFFRSSNTLSKIEQKSMKKKSRLRKCEQKNLLLIFLKNFFPISNSKIFNQKSIPYPKKFFCLKSLQSSIFYNRNHKNQEKILSNFWYPNSICCSYTINSQNQHTKLIQIKTIAI